MNEVAWACDGSLQQARIVNKYGHGTTRKTINGRSKTRQTMVEDGDRKWLDYRETWQTTRDDVEQLSMTISATPDDGTSRGKE